jgi:hypothetical protein
MKNESFAIVTDAPYRAMLVNHLMRLKPNQQHRIRHLKEMYTRTVQQISWWLSIQASGLKQEACFLKKF